MHFLMPFFYPLLDRMKRSSYHIPPSCLADSGILGHGRNNDFPAQPIYPGSNFVHYGEPANQARLQGLAFHFCFPIFSDQIYIQYMIHGCRFISASQFMIEITYKMPTTRSSLMKTFVFTRLPLLSARTLPLEHEEHVSVAVVVLPVDLDLEFHHFEHGRPVDVFRVSLAQ